MSEYNLLEENWIPCIDLEGNELKLGIEELVRNSHNLKEIKGDNQFETISLYRLIIAFVNRIYGINDEIEWRQLFDTSLYPKNKLNEYCENWKNRFFLYDDEYPFYQCASLKTSFEDKNKEIKDAEVELKKFIKLKDKIKIKEAKNNIKIILSKYPINLFPINKLDYTLTSNNNKIFFDHTMDGSCNFENDKSARVLVAFQNYGISWARGGGASMGPLSNISIFLIKGKTLFETILYNIIPGNVGYVVWENDDYHIINSIEKTDNLTRFTLLSWELLLIPNSNLVSQFLRGIKLKDPDLLKNDFNDPMTILINRKDESWVYSLTENKTVWRNFETILLKSGSPNFPLITLTNLCDILDDIIDTENIPWTFEIYTVKFSSQQSSVKYATLNRFNIPQKYYQQYSLLWEELLQSIIFSETIYILLNSSLKNVFKQIYPGKSKQDVRSKIINNNIIQNYWTTLEQNFSSIFLVDNYNGNELDDWINIIEKLLILCLNNLREELDSSQMNLFNVCKNDTFCKYQKYKKELTT